jgi:hypothetical protein
VNENRKAEEWLMFKRLERDFFQELQFVSEQAHKAKLDELTWTGLIVMVMTSPLLFVILLLAIADFSK